MNSRHSHWIVVLLLLSPLCPAADVRTWTDKQGQTVRGEFVRVHEGRVVLKSGTKTMLVPLAGLSQQDQDYIASQINRKVNKDGGGDAPMVRIWTDTRGNQIVAAFLRMEETQVILLDSGRPRAIAFMEISPADRTHIKDLLRGKGEEQAVAALEQHEEAAAKAAEAAREAARQSAPAPAAPAPNPIFEQMRQREEQRRQEDEQRRQAFEQQQQAERERRAREAEEQRQRWQQQEQERQQRIQEQQQKMQEHLTSLSTGPTMVTEYRCSNCNKQVPDTVGAGGNCPHCGVYFEYSTTAGGQRQYASGDGSSESRRYRISGRAIKGVIFLVIAVVGGIAGLWKKFGS